MSAGALLGVDWGTTNLRAFRLGADGAVLETRRSGAGLSSVKDRAFEPALRAVIGDWMAAAPARLILCGMAGAREGWIEAPYATCPATLSDLAAALVRAPAPSLDAWIAPGLSCARADGLTDVMRGEETQIFGALDARADAIVIAPGTHSKWARVSQGRIIDIRTFMTGELFALLKTHSILARLMAGDAHDEDAFLRGVARALADPALTNLLFSVRTEGLFHHIAPEALSAYLSGLLIGAEIAGAATDRDAAITLIGAPEISARYRAALAHAGFARIESVSGEDAAARGLWRLAQAKSLA